MLIVSEFERNHLAGWMVKTALTCPVERCEERFISWKKPNFVIASKLYAKSLLGLLQTKLAGLSNLHLLTLVKHFEGKVAWMKKFLGFDHFWAFS